MHERPHSAGTPASDPAEPDASQLVRLRNGQSAEVGEPGSGLSGTASTAEQRASLEKTWPTSAIYKTKE